MIDAHTLGTKYRNGELSPVEAVDACLQKIDKLNPGLHAFTSVFRQSAIDAAKQAAEKFACGDVRGPLQGVPIAIKDLATCAEGPSGAGTSFLQKYLGQNDAELVSLLRQQGAVIVGKTTMTEGAFSVHHPEVSTPINPWAPDHWAGVSSSGSGVAVAAGMVPMALGSDTGGSIRLPSACNRIVGHKPTFGVVSVRGCFPLAPSLDHMGPMARTVEDCELMFRTISRSSEARKAGPLQRRIGVDFELLDQYCSDLILQLMQAVIQDYRDLDIEIVPVRLPTEQMQLAAGWIWTTAAEAAVVHAPYASQHEAEYGPALSFLLTIAESVSEQQLSAIGKAAASYRTSLDTLLESVDAILCPVLPTPVLTVAAMAAHQPSPEDMAQSMLFTAPFNYSGHPALTLPAGFTESVPAGYQLVGPRGRDLSLFKLARQHESLRRWPESVPDLSWLTEA